jgi:hypothetical protein
VRHATGVYYTLQDVVLSVSFTCTPPTAVGPRYELQQVALFDPAFIEAFPTPTLAAESIEHTLRSCHYPFARVTIREPSQDVRGHGVRYIGRVFLPSVASFRMVQRNHPSGMPLSTTTHTCGVITSRMLLEPPPGGYPHHGPGELVMPQFESQQLCAYEDPPAMLITGAEVFHREAHIRPADHHTTDRAYEETDRDGNRRFVLCTSLTPAALMAVAGFRVFPDGVAREDTALMIRPALRSILNVGMGGQLEPRAEGQRRPATDPRARLLELFPAVGVVHTRLQSLQRTAETARRRGAAPFMVEIAEAPAPAGGTLLATPFSTSFSSHSFPLVSGCHSLQHFVPVLASLKSLPFSLYLVPATFSLSLLNLCYVSDPNAVTLHLSLCNCCAQQALLTWTEDRWPHSGDVAMIDNIHVSPRFPLCPHSSVFLSEPIMFFHSDWLDTFSASSRAPQTAHKMSLMSSPSCSFAGASIFQVVRPVSVASRSWVNHAIGITSGLSFHYSAVERGIHSSPGSLTFLQLLHGPSLSLLGVMAPGVTAFVLPVTITQWRTSCILMLLLVIVPYLRFASTYTCMLWRRLHVCYHWQYNPCGQRHRIYRACRILYTRLCRLSLYSCIIFSIITYVHQLPSPVQLQAAYRYIPGRSRNRRYLRRIPSIVRTSARIYDTTVSHAVAFMQRRGIIASDTYAANLSWSTILMYPTALLSFSVTLVTNNHQPSILQLMNGIASQSLTLIDVHLTIEILFLSIFPIPCYMRFTYQSLRLYLLQYASSVYSYYVHSSRTMNCRSSFRRLHVISRTIH